jgi:hypothetical protein
MVHLGCMRQQPFELPANVAFGSKTEIGPAILTSVLPSTADIRQRDGHVRKV